jgi:hypothetical protein
MCGDNLSPEWKRKYGRLARRALPILVKLAKNPSEAGNTITYRELGERLNATWRHGGEVAGIGQFIRDVLCRPKDGSRNLPLLNCLIVRKEGTPGWSWTEPRQTAEPSNRAEFKNALEKVRLERWETHCGEFEREFERACGSGTGSHCAGAESTTRGC